MLIQKIFIPQPVFSQGDAWSSRCAVNGVATIQGIECLFQNILKILVPIAGLVFFAMFLVGGFKYLASSGDSKKAAAASHTLTMAFIGLIGVIISWLILLFIERFTGVNITEFSIPN